VQRRVHAWEQSTCAAQRSTRLIAMRDTACTSSELFLQLLARCWGPDPDPWGFNRSRSVRTAVPSLPSGQLQPSAQTRRLGAWRCTAHGTVTRERTCRCSAHYRFFDPTAEAVESLPTPALTLQDALREAGFWNACPNRTPRLPDESGCAVCMRASGAYYDSALRPNLEAYAP
jgi:hypothetical protein